MKTLMNKCFAHVLLGIVLPLSMVYAEDNDRVVTLLQNTMPILHEGFFKNHENIGRLWSKYNLHYVKDGEDSNVFFPYTSGFIKPEKTVDSEFVDDGHNYIPGVRTRFLWKNDTSTIFGTPFIYYKIKVYDSEQNLRYNTGRRFLPMSDINGHYEHIMPYALEAGTYFTELRMAQYNNNQNIVTNSFTIGNGISGGYTNISVTVKYSGSDINDHIRIGVFRRPDFRSEYVTGMEVTNIAQLVSGVTLKVNSVPKGTYYIAAFIDSNDNWEIDTGEKWGYAMSDNCEPISVTYNGKKSPVAVTVNIREKDSTPIARDLDNDYMEDEWERKYSVEYVNPTIKDGDNDPDNDGWSNWAEFMANTDPMKSSDKPMPIIKAHIVYPGFREINNHIVVEAYNLDYTCKYAKWTILNDGESESRSQSFDVGVNSNRMVRMCFGPDDVRNLRVSAMVVGADGIDTNIDMYVTQNNFILSKGNVLVGKYDTVNRVGIFNCSRIIRALGGVDRIEAQWTARGKSKQRDAYYCFDANSGTNSVLPGVVEGRLNFIAYLDLNKNGTLDVDEPMGCANEVQVGYDGSEFGIMMSDMTEISDRINIFTGETARNKVFSGQGVTTFTNIPILAKSTALKQSMKLAYGDNEITQPLTLVPNVDDVTIEMETESGGHNPTKYLEWTTNGTWVALDYNTRRWKCNKGDYISFRRTKDWPPVRKDIIDSFCRINVSSNTSAYGNCGSMMFKRYWEDKEIPEEWAFSAFFYYEDSKTKKGNYIDRAPLLPYTHINKRKVYRGMFRSCYILTEPPELPATTLGNEAYAWMFFDCHSLKYAPELPATTLTVVCYQNMFSYCHSLKYAPELPATTLGGDAYYSMFLDCSSLEYAPELPATTLMPGCYYYMFVNCSSLKRAPDLPATTLVKAYNGMFENCTSLEYLKVGLTNELNGTGTSNWLDNVSFSGKFYCPKSLKIGTRDGSTVPSTWTIIRY